MKLTGARILMECLREQKVDTIFGYPGGTILNVYDALYDCKEITHILTSHEQGAAHAADGYARSTGKVGVCFATSGPGATNLTTGIATAYYDSSPVVFLTVNVPEPLIGKDTFQEVDITGITMPITKANFLVRDAASLADTLRTAFAIARSGRPGPVLIDILKNVTAEEVDYKFLPLSEHVNHGRLKEMMDIASHDLTSREREPDQEDVDKLLEVLAKEQPQIHLLSAAGEQMLQKKEAEKASRKLPESELTDDARHSITVLRRAKEYLEAKPEIADELSAAERRKRAQLQSKPVYRYVALAIFVMGIVSAAYGLYAVTTHTGGYGIYFALFGFAAIFLFSSYNMLPTAHNNHSAIMKRAEKAEAAMAEYVKHYPNGAFPVPSHYAHPIVLKQMADAIEEGRAVTVPEALIAVENRLKSLNADVQVEQEEYDEVVVIKAMFLNHDYQ